MATRTKRAERLIRAFIGRVAGLLLLCALTGTSGCRRGIPVVELDHPHLSQNIRAIDSHPQSDALGHSVRLRIVVPADETLSTHPLPVVYLLHGAGTNLHDWTNNSDIATFAAKGFVLVFPDAPGSYYIDDLRDPQNRYEEYLLHDVPAAVHAAVPFATHDPRETALVGISRGGYGAAVLGLKHPEMFGFLSVLSGALDLNHRRFHWKHPIDSRDVDRAFGPLGSKTRHDNDVDRLIATVPPQQAPYFFVACGEQDSLYAMNDRFAQQLADRHMPFESHFAAGGHNWLFWGSEMPALESALQRTLVPAGAR